jgi:hypothetical protein
MVPDWTGTVYEYWGKLESYTGRSTAGPSGSAAGWFSMGCGRLIVSFTVVFTDMNIRASRIPKMKTFSRAQTAEKLAQVVLGVSSSIITSARLTLAKPRRNIMRIGSQPARDC